MSFNNRILIAIQSMQQNQYPIIGTVKQWEKEGCFIRKGETASCILCMPLKKYYYGKREENGKIKLIDRIPLSKSEADEIYKKIDQNEYILIPSTTYRFKKNHFFLNQTTMKEIDRMKYIQRFNAENTSEENNQIYKILLDLCEKLNVEVIENDNSTESLGLTYHSKDVIEIMSDQTVDSKISVLAHEMGHRLMKHTSDLYYPHEYQLSRGDKEVQAQLISDLVLSGNGIFSEKTTSINYIDGWIRKENKSETLFNHLSLCYDISMKINDYIKLSCGETIDLEKQEEIVNEIKNFQPNFFKYDNENNKSFIVKRDNYLNKNSINEKINNNEKELVDSDFKELEMGE